MITQELAKELADKAADWKGVTDHPDAWFFEAIAYTRNHKTIIADREALRVAFELECG